jgi:ubiquinone/menaquinone biosynthesis C-methylase UbiE
MKKEAIKTDWAKRAKTYDNIDWVNRDDTLKAILSFVAGVSVKKVLDIGTGTGKVIKSVKQTYLDSECYGIDISLEMESELLDDENYIISQMNCENMQFESEMFDIVTARMSLHHVANLEDAVNEVFRVLKPGGKFIICEGTPPSVNATSFYKEVFSYKEERHTFLCDDLVNILLKMGLVDVTAKIIVSPNMSLNNWVENAGTPEENVEILKKLHWEADEEIKADYNMKVVENDITMDWKFVVACGTKELPTKVETQKT